MAKHTNYSNKKKKRKTPIWPWILIGILLILLAVGGFAAYYFMSGNSQTDSFDGDTTPTKQYEAYYEPIKEDQVVYDHGIHYIKSHLLLVAEENATFDQVKALLAEKGGEIIGYLEISNDYQVNFPEEKSYEELNVLIKELEASEGISEGYLEEVHETSFDAVAYETDPWQCPKHKEDEKNGWVDLNNIHQDTTTLITKNKTANGTNWWAEAIRLPALWKTDYTFSNIHAGLLDSYFDNDNPDLSEVFSSEHIYGQDGINVASEYSTALKKEKQEGYEGTSSDVYAHGTVDAALIGAKNNDYGICGVSQNVTLYGVSLFGGKEKWQQSSMTYKYGIAKLLNDNVKIISISMGYGDAFNIASMRQDQGMDTRSQAEINSMNTNKHLYESFLKKCLSKYDFLITKSAGNSSGYYKEVERDEENSYGYKRCSGDEEGAFYVEADAKYDFLGCISDKTVKNHIVIVGALDNHLPKDSTVMERYGVSLFSTTGSRVDVYAPGGYIWNGDKTTHIRILSDYPDKKIDYMQGTSQATPIAAGVAALIWGSNPNLTGQQVKRILVNSGTYHASLDEGSDSNSLFSSDFIPYVERESHTAFRMVNAYNAVVMAHDTNGFGDNSFTDSAFLLGYSYHKVAGDNGEEREEKLDLDATLYNEDKTQVIHTLDLDEEHDFAGPVPPGTYTLVISHGNHREFDDYEETFTLEANQTEFKPIEMKGSRDIVLVLDRSGSMNGNPIHETKEAASSFVDSILEDGTRIGLVTYSNRADIVSGLSEDQDALKSDIENIGAGGDTNTYHGLQAADGLLSDSHSSRKIIVLMSDGLPNEGEHNGSDYSTPLIRYANELKDKGYIIYTLGFFSSVKSGDLAGAQNLMQSIASPGLHYEVENAEDLRFFFGDIATQIDGGRYVYIRIECPVHVKVTHNGETLSSHPDTENTRTDFGTLTYEQVEEETEGGEESNSNSGGDNIAKVLRLKMDHDYDIEIEGYDSGTMNYSISYPDDAGEYKDVRAFKKLPVNSSMKAKTNTAEGKTTEIYLDEDGDGSYEKTYENTANGKMHEVVKKPDRTLLYVAIALVSFLLLILVISILSFISKSKKKKKEQERRELERQRSILEQLSHGYVYGVKGSFEENRYLMEAERDECTVGRDKNCSIVIDHSNVSRLHCTIWLMKDGNYMVIDSSSNGTYVNQNRLDPGKKYILARGSRLAIGNDMVNILELR